MAVEGRGNRVTPYRFLLGGSAVKSDGDAAPDVNGDAMPGRSVGVNPTRVAVRGPAFWPVPERPHADWGPK